jgi:hypothetical protein
MICSRRGAGLCFRSVAVAAERHPFLHRWIPGRGENQSTGKIVKLPLNAGSTTSGGLTYYDNSFAPANNTTFILTGV